MRRENSGLIDLDALLKEASQPELPKSADSSLEVSAPPPEPPPSAPAVEAPPPPPRPTSSSSVSPSSDDSLRAITTAKPSPPPPAKRRSSLPWLVLAVAAGAGIVATLVMSKRSSEPIAQQAAASPEPKTAAVVTTAVAPGATTETTSATGTSLGDLPMAATASASAAHVVHAPAHAATAAAAATAKLGEIAESAPAANGDLGGAMRDAVGARAPEAIATAEPSPGEGARQLSPSPGAVVGAINSVMPAARMCLDGSEVVRNATIVFKSDGTVARVDIAGSPNVADDCIRGALANARTTPFLADTFAARATVRP